MHSVFSRLSAVAAQGQKKAANPDSNSDGEDASSLTATKKPTAEFIAEERKRCTASFHYFCTHYGFVVEPRPPDDGSGDDTDEEKDFLEFFAQKEYQATLSAEALGLLQKDLDELHAEKGYNPELPFSLWPFQRRAAAWLEWLLKRGHSGAIEKCRDMGMSWLVLWFLIWCWLFRPGFSALLGSRKEAAVDNGKLDSLFGKLDFAINKLPEWIKPEGYDRTKHRTKLSIVNPSNGSFLVGDSQTEEFGRGGRYTIIFLDEYAFWTRDVWGSVRQATKTVIAGSTVNGENHFYRLTKRLRGVSPVRVFKMLWNENPTHTDKWYAQQEAENDEADFAREVLIDYKASVKGHYYPMCNLVKVVDHLDWEPGWTSYLSWDYGVRDNCAMIWWQKNPFAGPTEPLYRMMFAYTNAGQPIEYYIPFAKALHPDECVPIRDEETGRAVARRRNPRTALQEAHKAVQVPAT